MLLNPIKLVYFSAIIKIDIQHDETSNFKSHSRRFRS